MTRRLPRQLLLSLAVLLAGASAFAQSARLAVLPVVIHSIEESGYLRDGIAEMLSSRLDQQAGLSALRVDDANARHCCRRPFTSSNNAPATPFSNATA